MPERLCQAFSEAQLVAPVDGTRCRLGDQGEDNFEGASNEAVERGQEVVQPDGRGPPPERLLIGAKIGLTGEDLSGWPVADPIRAVVVDLPAPGPGFLSHSLLAAPISPPIQKKEASCEEEMVKSAVILRSGRNKAQRVVE